MANRQPRLFVDEEREPLLRDGEEAHHEPTWGERITSVVQEPLSALTKLLLILVLVLLILSAVFIGLFAGTYTKWHNRGDGGWETITSTIVRTSTITATRTQPTTSVQATTTVQTSIQTSIQTTTAVETRTKTVVAPVPTGRPTDGVCFSADCIRLSASILSSLDTSVDPCENFYDFANGGWLKEHPLPADKGRYGNFDDLSVKNQQVIREILESNEVPSAASSDDEQILHKLRGFYSSCMNEDLLNEIGQAPLVKFVDSIKGFFKNKKRGGDEVERKRRALTAALAFVHSRGIEGLFDFDIDGDVGKDPNAMTLWFSQPSLGLPAKEYFDEKSIVKLYRNVIERLLIASSGNKDKKVVESQSKPPSEFRVNEKTYWPPTPWPPWDDDDEEDDVDYHKLAKDVVKFEARIAEISLDLDKLYQDPFGTYNPVPISNVTRTLGRSINFGDYFAAFTTRAYPERVVVTSPAFMRALADILEETNVKVVEGYLIARSALAFSQYLGDRTEAWKAQRALFERLNGVKPGAVGDRSQYCIGTIENTMGFAAGRYFSNVTFGGESKEKGTKVITDIIHAFKHSLDDLDWMDKKSAKAAAEKADALRVKVGFPLSPDTRNPRSIANYYYLVKVDKHDFFGNILSARESDAYKKWQKLGKRRDPEAWEMYPSQVNAYFNPPANEIVFPAGILQPPFFSQDWPGYLSYGSFGQVAAHELTHAFDSAGRLYNPEGKLEEWWTKATSEGFNKRQTCLAKQYSSYYVLDPNGKKVYVNGNLTSGENIGDTGVIQAYRAWKAQYDDSLKAGDEYALPGLEYTREQLFFISFARAWAQNIKPAAAVQRVRTDPHSPNNFRVDGTVYNVPEFAKAFKCSKKAKLNPPQEKRCLFW